MTAPFTMQPLSDLSDQQLLDKLQQAQQDGDAQKADVLLREYSARAARVAKLNSVDFIITKGQVSTQESTQTVITVSLEGPRDKIHKVLDAARQLSGFADTARTNRYGHFEVDDTNSNIETWLQAQVDAVNAQSETEPPLKLVRVGHVNPKRPV